MQVSKIVEQKNDMVRILQLLPDRSRQGGNGFLYKIVVGTPLHPIIQTKQQ